MEGNRGRTKHGMPHVCTYGLRKASLHIGPKRSNTESRMILPRLVVRNANEKKKVKAGDGAMGTAPRIVVQRLF